MKIILFSVLLQLLLFFPAFSQQKIFNTKTYIFKGK